MSAPSRKFIGSSLNSPRKVYKVKLTEGKTYQIDLKSKDFDAVLRLEDPAGKEIAFNDDFEPGSLVLETISQGWPHILANLKTLLETGETLPQPVEAQAAAR